MLLAVTFLHDGIHRYHIFTKKNCIYYKVVNETRESNMILQKLLNYFSGSFHTDVFGCSYVWNWTSTDIESLTLNFYTNLF